MSATGTIGQPPVREPQRSGLVGPSILIGLGLVFLANNLGWLSWGVWETIIRLWPVLLIAVGLDLLVGRRSALWSLLVAALMFAVLGVAIWLSGTWFAGWQPLVSETIAQPLGAASRAEVNIAMGVGTLRVGAQAEPGGLIEGTLSQSERDEARQEFAVRGDTAVYKLHSTRQSAWGQIPWGERPAAIWDLRLNPNVPTELDLATGAGNATIDLSRLQISRLDVATGIGTTAITLPARGNVRAGISGGVGETTIHIPEGVAARVDAATGLGQVRVVGDFERRDRVYTSPGFETAADRVDLQVAGGVGSVTIRYEKD